MRLAYAGNFADPFLLRVPGRGVFAYATNGELGNVQLLRSDDLERWEEVGDALPNLPDWVRPGRTWAPEVMPLPDGRFAMYYTARCIGTDRQAVGAALADVPEGPFVDALGGPLVDQDEGGSIDASPFVDADGSAYLLWKNDGNAIGVDTWIYLQALAPGDRTGLVGERHQLIKQDHAWEGDLVEGPFVWLRDGRYYLFYAANAFDKETYAEGYATADRVTGPYRKAEENPILASGEDVDGPGHASMVEYDGRTFLGFHAWPKGAAGQVPPGRQFWIDEVVWKGGRPVVGR